MARDFAAQGHRVVVGYRSQPPPAELTGVYCDVTDTESVDQAFKQVEALHGSPEVVISNAGEMRDKLAITMSDDDFTDLIDTNLVGAFRVTRRAIPSMLEGRWGRLIFIASFSGTMGSPGQANYAASKTGLLGLARSLARELGSRGITANLIAPGFIDTDMVTSVSAKRRAEYIAMTAVGRPGRPEDVAAAATFLAGESAGYITGAVIPVSGGLGMGS
jgi:3-oxoacyl-[acyl-carrier protein] reductase